MTKCDLETALIEAERFVDAAERLNAFHMPDRDKDHYRTSKEAASCKRASLDLTRALAQLRKPA